MYCKTLILSIILSLSILTGCITVDSNERTINANKPSIYFGLIMLKHDAKNLHSNVNKFDTLGVWVSPAGSGLGYKNYTNITPNPDCQIVFLVETNEQLTQSIKFIESTSIENGENICASKI